MSMVAEEFLAFLSMERGALYTSVRLLRSPGSTILQFLDGASGVRRRLTNPLRYLAMSVALVTLAYVLFLPSDNFARDIENGMSFSNTADPLAEEDESILALRTQASTALDGIAEQADDRMLRLNAKEASETLQETLAERLGEITLTWMNVFLLAVLPMNTLLTWIVFRRAKFNLAEHFVINAFILGFQNVLAIAMLPPSVLIDVALFTLLYMLFSFAFQFIAWKQVFGVKRMWPNLFCFGLVLISAFAYVMLQAVFTFAILAIATRG